MTAEGLRCVVSVRVEGLAGRSVWEAISTHVGLFRLDADAAVSAEDVRDIFAPAYIDSFAREHIADMTTRARRNAILPPAHFHRSLPEKS